MLFKNSLSQNTQLFCKLKAYQAKRSGRKPTDNLKITAKD